MNNKDYNDLILNILFFNKMTSSNKNKENHLDRALSLIKQVNISELYNYNSIFPLINDKKLIKNFQVEQCLFFDK